jgi:hypothetical protein
MPEIAIDDPRFDELLDRVVQALMALEGSFGTPPVRRRRRRALVRRVPVAA